jgi:RHS repeat-associated protein
VLHGKNLQPLTGAVFVNSLQVIDSLQENPFTYGASVPESFNLRYPGQYFDKESGLSYNYFRSYDSRTGRYSQSDPIGLDGGWNRFGYAEQNPLSFSDPQGLQATIPVPRTTIPAFTSACLANPALCGPVLAGAGGYAVGTLIYPIIERPLSRAIDYCFSDSTSNGECKKQCDAQLDRDEAECLVARAGYGTRGQAVCLAKAKEYYARCLRSCDGK